MSTRLFYNEGLTATYYHLAKGEYLLGNYAEAIDDMLLCAELEESVGAYLYTPLFKSDLLMCYAHLGLYDSLEAELNRKEIDYNNISVDKLRLEKDVIELPAIRENVESMKSTITKYRYVIVGLVTLLVVLAIYTIVSGRPKKEK